MAMAVVRMKRAQTQATCPTKYVSVPMRSNKISFDVMEKKTRKCVVPGCNNVFTLPTNKPNSSIKGSPKPNWSELYFCNEHSKNQLIKVEGSLQDSYNLQMTSPLISPLKRNNTSDDNPVDSKSLKLVRNVASSSYQRGTAVAGNMIGVSPKQPIIRSSNPLKLKPGTSIKIAANNKEYSFPIVSSNGPVQTSTPVRRQAIFIRAPVKTSIRNVTIELIEKSPKLHLGVTSDRLNIFKTIVCAKANIPLVELYITLKKLRLNEDFALLSEYFEYSEDEIQTIFSRTVIKLSKYLKFLIRWPEGKKYYDRHKNLPIPFRSKLSYVQSLIECVETDIRMSTHPALDILNCKNFKFILTITPSGIISYISDAFMGNNDDLTIFNACNFRNLIPKYLSLLVDPGEAVHRQNKEVDSDSTTDSADEVDEVTKYPQKTEEHRITNISHTMNVVDSKLTSLKVKDFSIPTLRVREPACRKQIRNIINNLRDFKVLQPYAVLEPQLFSNINEILIVISAVTNLQRSLATSFLINDLLKYVDKFSLM